MTIEVKIIADSINPAGSRLTTFQLRYPRIVHSELMTHRALSRNASSSRAIPIAKQILDVADDPFVPTYWGKNQKGMQSGEELAPEQRAAALKTWMHARDNALASARELLEIGLHKEWTNRLLEPFSHISVVLTATEWDNWYGLRCHKDAHPVINNLAEQMLSAHNASDPVLVPWNGWHLPYAPESMMEDISTALKVSVARCARVSYNNHYGKATTIEEDVELHNKLAIQEPLHASPMEHQARAQASDPSAFVASNFRGGWVQYRKMLKNETIREFKRLIKK
jgi:hypothetical protein